MARRPPSSPPSRVLGKPQLESAIRTLDKRIAELKAFDVSSIQERWDPRVEALETKIGASLAEIFGEDTPEYRRHSLGMLDSLPVSMLGDQYPTQQIQASIKEGIQGAVVRLTSLRELLAERLEVAAPNQTEQPRSPKELSNQVFIVHGRDEAAKEATARFIAQLGLKPIILHEQPNAGRTIIEKLEHHLDVGFAVILLTPDDVGGLAVDPPQLQIELGRT